MKIQLSFFLLSYRRNAIAVTLNKFGSKIRLTNLQDIKQLEGFQSVQDFRVRNYPMYMAYFYINCICLFN